MGVAYSRFRTTKKAKKASILPQPRHHLGLNPAEFKRQRDAMAHCTVQNTENLELGGYVYAKVLDVYDGDTITCSFMLNDHIYKSSVRFNGIDCPEMKGESQEEKKHAMEGKEFVSQLIGNMIMLGVHADKKKYGRVTADIILVDDQGVPLEHLKTQMLERQLAVEYHGEKRGSWTYINGRCVNVMTSEARIEELRHEYMPVKPKLARA